MSSYQFALLAESAVEVADNPVFGNDGSLLPISRLVETLICRTISNALKSGSYISSCRRFIELRHRSPFLRESKTAFELDKHLLQTLLFALEDSFFAHMEPTEILVDDYVFPNDGTKKWMLDETSVFGFGISETRKGPNLILGVCTKCQRKVRAKFVVGCFLNILRQNVQKLPANFKFSHRIHMRRPTVIVITQGNDKRACVYQSAE